MAAKKLLYWRVGALVGRSGDSVGWLYPLNGKGGLGEVGREDYSAAALGIRCDGGLGSRGDT